MLLRTGGHFLSTLLIFKAKPSFSQNQQSRSSQLNMKDKALNMMVTERRLGNIQSEREKSSFQVPTFPSGLLSLKLLVSD